LQREGTFREDLYARLDEYQLRLPPLRDRKEDVFMLVRALLGRHGRPDLVPSFLYMTALLHHDWPYNVRELEACIKRSIALANSTKLDSDELPEAIHDAMSDYGQRPSPASPDAAAPSPTQAPQRAATPTEAELRALLEAHGGNVAAVGRQLGKARMQVHRWMNRYGIDVDEFRAVAPNRTD
jgi:DNA-binding NtrC family response regulator